MAEYLFELAQLAKLLSPLLITNNAIRHFPPDVRSALIVARPSNFAQMSPGTCHKKIEAPRCKIRSGRAEGTSRGDTTGLPAFPGLDSDTTVARKIGPTRSTIKEETDITTVVIKTIIEMETR